ncbi:malate dehydrogenase [Hibiscus syriacus]|uniref:Malate dehydrogenase n=1 Tax=Hibiscus syriacus TaxID=106335 RepID=A0A6A3BAK8_HIBSY|nr:mitochondrial amidoxime reducing component 2-like [Hibiscus syriacus]KAE8713956.1 malate dehydrogenase [Hibiscus syriacus]
MRSLQRTKEEEVKRVSVFAWELKIIFFPKEQGMEKTASSTEAAAAVADAKISSIFIYPIKSCRGISVPQAPLTPTGFRWDRHWLVVNQKGRAYSQRAEAKLALVEVNLPKEAFYEGWEPTENTYMEIKSPGMDLLKISLCKPPQVVADGVSILGWSGSALDEGDEASKWFTDFLGKPSRMVRFNAASETRPVDPVYAQGHSIMFSDQYPFMLTSQESLDALNKLLPEPVPINRFRPNILVAGCEPFSEDLWTEIQISRFSFQGVKLCARCKVPTINQDTAIAGPEPNETLMKVRSDRVLRPDKKQQGKIYFGQNLVCKESPTEGKAKMVKVGDPVYVIDKVSTAAEAAA